MPWRLIVIIIVFALLLVFITFNLDNKCDISFGPEPFTIKDVPVFLTIFISFALGLICTLPFIAAAGKKRRDNRDNPVKKTESIMEKKRREFREKHNKTGKSKDDAFFTGGYNDKS